MQSRPAEANHLPCDGEPKSSKSGITLRWNSNMIRRCCSHSSGRRTERSTFDFAGSRVVVRDTLLDPLREGGRHAAGDRRRMQGLCAQLCACMSFANRPKAIAASVALRLRDRSSRYWAAASVSAPVRRTSTLVMRVARSALIAASSLIAAAAPGSARRSRCSRQPASNADCVAPRYCWVLCRAVRTKARQARTSVAAPGSPGWIRLIRATSLLNNWKAARSAFHYGVMRVESMTGILIGFGFGFDGAMTITEL